MMITDGQLLFETFDSKSGASGTSVVLGTGPMLDAAALITACKYTASNQRTVFTSLLNTYLKTTLGRTILVDTSFSNVNRVLIKGPYFQFSFSKATATPTVAASGTPTWGLLLTPNSGGGLADGASVLTSKTYQITTFVFSVGAPNSGADLIIPGDGTLTEGQIFRMNDIRIPISNVVS